MSARAMVFRVAMLLLLVGVAVAAEPDWFTRVKEMGVEAASRQEVERHEQGILKDSLHVGRCYFELGRYEEGLAVNERLLRSPDLNYAAMARVAMGEALFRLGRDEEARAAFAACLAQHPDAWFDGSIAERCRAWQQFLDGKLKSAERIPGEPREIDQVKAEMEDLSKRLAELRKLLLELAEEE